MHFHRGADRLPKRWLAATFAATCALAAAALYFSHISSEHDPGAVVTVTASDGNSWADGNPWIDTHSRKRLFSAPPRSLNLHRENVSDQALLRLRESLTRILGDGFAVGPVAFEENVGLGRVATVSAGSKDFVVTVHRQKLLRAVPLGEFDGFGDLQNVQQLGATGSALLRYRSDGGTTLVVTMSRRGILTLWSVLTRDEVSSTDERVEYSARPIDSRLRAKLSAWAAEADRAESDVKG